MRMTTKVMNRSIIKSNHDFNRNQLLKALLRWREHVTSHFDMLHDEEPEQHREIANKILLQVVIAWMGFNLLDGAESFLKAINDLQHRVKRKRTVSCTCISHLFHELLTGDTQNAEKLTETQASLDTVDDMKETPPMRLPTLLAILDDDEWKFFLELPCSFFSDNGNVDEVEILTDGAILNLLRLAKKVNIKIDGYFLGSLHQSCMERNDRKNKGVFYTPPTITKEIVKKSLRHYLIAASGLSSAKELDSGDWDELLNEMNYFQLMKAFQVVLNMKILDPACGSGHFLETAMDLLLELTTSIWKKLNTPPRRKKIFNSSLSRPDDPLWKNILEFMEVQSENQFKFEYLVKVLFPRTLHGIDLNPLAVKIAKLRLILKFWSQHSSSSTRKQNLPMIIPARVTCGNALFDPSLGPATFDVIIGNPPYGRSVLKTTDKKALLKDMSCLNTMNPKKRSFNSAALFIEKSLKLVKDGGILGLIVPQSITRVEEYQCLREKILEESHILEIVDEGSSFQGVTLEMITMYLQKKKTISDQKNASSGHEVVRITSRRKIFDYQVSMRSTVNVNLYKKFKRFFLYVDDFFHVLIKDKQFNIIQGDYGLDHRRVDKDLQPNPSGEHFIPFLHSGKSVKKYYLDEKFFSWSRRHDSKRFNMLLQQQNIVTTAIAMLPRAALKPPGIVPGTNVSIQRIVNCPKLHPKTAVIILNSSLIGYYVHRYILNFSQLTVYLHKYYTKLIPVMVPHNQQPFVALHDYLVTLTRVVRTSSSSSIQATLTDLGLDVETIKKMQHFFHHVISETLVLELYLSEWLEKKGITRELTEYLNQQVKTLSELDYSCWKSFRLIFYDIEALSKRLKNIYEIYQQMISEEFMIAHSEKIRNTVKECYGLPHAANL